MRQPRFWGGIALAAGATIVMACSDRPTAPAEPEVPIALKTSGGTGEPLESLVENANVALLRQGASYRLGFAEALTDGTGDEAGILVIASDSGNKQLAHHFVPGDPRRGGFADIAYITDQTEGNTTSGLTTAQTTAAIDRAMATWNGQSCSTVPITALANIPGVDLGVVEFLNGLGGLSFPVADVTHAGWLPAGLLPTNVIGVTFTFIFVDNNGNPTDVDNNGKLDTAFREILYNDAFSWAINGNVDVQTVALHESGHGLSQAHFGKVFFKNTGQVQFAPRALMNAVYAGVLQSPLGTDQAGHCSIWASWPNN